MEPQHDVVLVEAAVDHWSGISPNRIKWAAYEEDDTTIVRLSAVNTEDGRGVFIHMDVDDFRIVMQRGLELCAKLAEVA